MGVPESMVLRLVQRIYAAVDSPPAWHDFLVDLAACTDAGPSAMFVGSVVELNPHIDIVLDMSPYYQRLLKELYPECPFAPFIGQVQPGDIYSHRWILERITEEQFVNNSWYQKWARPQNIHYGLGLTIWREGAVAAGLTLFRSLGAGDFKLVDTELLKLLCPHLQTALRLRHKLTSLAMSERSLCDSMMHSGCSLVLVRHDGKIVRAAPEARRLLDVGDGLFDAEGYLRARSRADAKQLKEAIESAACYEEQTTSEAVLKISRQSSLRPLSIALTPLPREEMDVHVETRPVAILINDPEAVSTFDISTVRDLYELTPAEARLCAAIAEGRSLKSAADDFGVSIGTLRKQLKAVYSKVGVHRQSELVVRLNRSGPIARN